MKIINPATEEVVANISEDIPSTLEHKLQLLRSGQQRWAKVALAQRVQVLQKFADLLNDNTEHLAATLTSEVGKPLQQSRNEVNGARNRIKWLTDNAAKYLSDEWMADENGLGEKISYEPLGIVCNISAWNYPFFSGRKCVLCRHCWQAMQCFTNPRNTPHSQV
jgi:acyl-CoA reductase-like NAD-dependent aldehyde dehydrogenase